MITVFLVKGREELDPFHYFATTTENFPLSTACKVFLFLLISSGSYRLCPVFHSGFQEMTLGLIFPWVPLTSVGKTSVKLQVNLNSPLLADNLRWNLMSLWCVNHFWSAAHREMKKMPSRLNVVHGLFCFILSATHAVICTSLDLLFEHQALHKTFLILLLSYNL